ncbi:MAG: 50S ribosomal protein L35 [Lactococcus chungangensis]
MPKQKSHRASAKRFKAYTSHRFHGKTKKQRRHLRKAGMVSTGDYKRIRKMVYSLK